MRIISFLFASLLSILCFGQQRPTPFMNVEKILLDSSDADYGYYLSVKPQSGNIDGVVVLLPGFGQKSEDIFLDTWLHQFAAQNNLLTIGFAGRLRLAADDIIREKLNAVLTDVLARYPVNKSDFVFGGFSAGGAIALRYVEWCKQFPEQYPVDPKGVFMADAPVDLFHSWNMTQTLKEKAYSKVSIDEANWIEKVYRNIYGATPAEDPKKFAQLTPFSMDEQHSKNEVYLKDVAVRAYHDVDIAWRLNNRNQSVQYSNYLATSELINRLLLLGNERAEFVQTHRTGFRRNGKRHPHSWSIIDEKECVDWILTILSENSQEEDEGTNREIVKPLLIDQQHFSGVNLLRGRNPEQADRKLFFRNIFSGKELRVQIVSSETASASPEDLGIDEFIYLINGGARLAPKNAPERTYLTGDFFMVPRGYAGDWETLGATEYHHEVSITTMQRNENPYDPNKTLPVLMDRQKLAGLGITKLPDRASHYRDVLYDGHELKVVLDAEPPGVKNINAPLSEQVIYIVSGMLTLWDTAGEEQTFYAGDFIILPVGFTGTWQSEGHNLFRFLRVFKSD